MSEISRGVITSESNFRDRIDKHLHKYFIVFPEVKQHNGRLRIDYILKCKKSGVFFGLEVKREHKQGQKKNGREWGALLKQAHNYSLKFWDIPDHGVKSVPVFIAPALSKSLIEIDIDYKPISHNQHLYYKPKHDLSHRHSNVNSLVGSALNLGEVKGYAYKYGFYFLHNNFVIWSTDQGIHHQNYQRLTDKLPKL